MWEQNMAYVNNMVSLRFNFIIKRARASYSHVHTCADGWPCVCVCVFGPRKMPPALVCERSSRFDTARAWIALKTPVSALQQKLSLFKTGNHSAWASIKYSSRHSRQSDKHFHGTSILRDRRFALPKFYGAHPAKQVACFWNETQIQPHLRGLAIQKFHLFYFIATW